MPQATEATLQSIFRAVLNVPASVDVERIRQLNYPAWDSLAHVSLIAAIESEFGLEIDVADSMDLTSYEAVLVYLDTRNT